MAGNANRNVNVDITGDPSDLNRAYDNVSDRADKLDKQLEENDKKDRDRRKKTVEDATKGFQGLFDTLNSLAGSGVSTMGLVLAGILALGPASSLIAGTITLGLGGALLGIGIIAASQSMLVRGEFKQLWEGIKSDLSEIAGPIEQSLLRIPGVWQSVFGRFRPELETAFSNLAPTVDQFILNMGQGFQKLIPAIQPLQQGFSALLTSIGLEAPTIFGNFADAIATLGDTATKHADDFTSLLVGLSSFVSGTASFIGTIADEWDREMGLLEIGINGVGNQLIGWQPDLDNSGLKWRTLTQSAIDAANSLKDNQIVMRDLTVDADALSQSLDALSGAHINVDSAQLAVIDKFQKTIDLVRQNKEGLDLNTEAGRTNMRSVLDLATASQRLIEAKAKEGSTALDLGLTYQHLRQNMLDVFREMGLSEKKARELTQRYLEIPKEIKTAIYANTGDAQRSVDEFITLNSGRQIPVYLIQKQEGQAKDGGYFGYASGGPVRGPGGSRTDSIPARISRGEYVVNAAATRRNLPLLEAINSGRGVGGMGTTVIYQINTTVSPTANLAAVGAEIVEAVQAYETKSGRSWRAN
ncbi:hypothetical protein ACIBI9_31310 [Nonomuraea sp. NPDC050451]|uniref:hypothetical protein n=1 Tax=Nonomuraea sp. NPDC050451 TaxID=3364364 RepID=UPI00378FDDEA